MTVGPTQLLCNDLEASVKAFMSENSAAQHERRWRCHELARLFAQRFISEGHADVSVKDGIAVYSAEFWRGRHEREEAIKKALYPAEEEFDAMIAKFLPPKVFSTKSIIHSWCEVSGVVVDYHNRITLQRGEHFEQFVEGLLIVEPKGTSDGLISYDSCGKEFVIGRHRLLYVPAFPYVSKLRI